MKKNSFYFTHDYLARSDHKIKKLLVRHGITGYGIYWALVEDLYNNSNALPMDCDTIAYDLRCDVDAVKSIINDYDLFVINGEYFSSNSVGRRLTEREEKSKKASESANTRWEKKSTTIKSDANEMQTQCKRNAIKENKRKENKRNIFTKPSVEEVAAYCQERKNKIDPKTFLDYYETRGWAVGKNNTPMKDWHAAVRTWENNYMDITIDLGEGERITDKGDRTYGTSGIVVPHDAPPRPSRNHYWVNHRNEWEVRV